MSVMTERSSRGSGWGRSPALLLVLLAIGLASVLLGTGCRRRAAFGGVATVDARQVERLRRVGERDMHCPRGSLVMIPMTQSAVELRGCERIREYSLVCRRGRRCNWQAMMPAALLATRDLACPLESMSVSASSASTRDLVGCGRMGRYTLTCLDDAVCRWNLLAPVGPELAVATPPASYGSSYAAPEQSVSVPPPPGATGAVVVQPAVTGEVPPPPGASTSISGSATVSGEVIPPPPSGSTGPR